MKRSMDIGPQIVTHHDDDLEINLYQLDNKRTLSERIEPKKTMKLLD